MRPLITALVLALLCACEQRGRDIGKDPANAPSDPNVPTPSSSASAAPSPTFSGRDPFKPPDPTTDAGRDTH